MELVLHRISPGCYAPGDYDILISKEHPKAWSIRLYAQWSSWGRRAAPDLESLRFSTRRAALHYLCALFELEPPPDPIPAKPMSRLTREADGSYSCHSRTGKKLSIRRAADGWRIYYPDGTERLGCGAYSSLWEVRMLGLYDA